MKIAYYIVFFFVICFSVESNAQKNIPERKSPPPTLRPIPEQSAANNNPAAQDTNQIIQDTVKINASPDALDVEFEYNSVDSQHVNINENKVYLYGDAMVKYGEMEIKAGYIEFDLNAQEAFASVLTDKYGQSKGKPTFNNGEQTITYKKLRFNFKSQKGLVYDAVSQQGNLFIFGATTKFISKESDTLLFEDEIYNKNALVTTCNLDHPHYGIRTKKLKVVPEKLAILGPANLEIAGIPTPLVLPFGFLPIIGGGGQTNGLIFPQDYEYSQQLGFGFREVGYYYRMSEYMEFRVTGDIYTRGSWGLRVGTNYAKRYKYRGNFQVGYSRQLTEIEGQLDPNVQKSISFKLNHNQDAKAHPYRNIGGNLNFTTNDYDRRNFNDPDSQIENIINSNFALRHTMPGTPFNFSTTFGHNQNTRTRLISFNLPDVKLRMNAIQPFKRKVSTGGEKWFERINLSYNGRFKSFVSTQDTVLFTKQTLEDWQIGFEHDVSTGTSINLLKYFNFSPNVSYEETWYFKESFRQQDTTTSLGYEDVLRNKFQAFRNLNASVNLSTNIFGTMQFKKGKLRGVRHVIKPSIGFNFSPNTERYYDEYFPDDDLNNAVEYNPFPQGIFSRPFLREKQMALTYNITNIIEGKYWSKRDSTEKKFKLFNNLALSGSHNFAADSLRWSRVRMGGSARFFDGITSVNLQATLDPYVEVNNRRVNTTVWSGNKRPLRFEDFTARFTTGFTFRQLKELFEKKDEEEEGQGGTSRNRSRNRSRSGSSRSPQAEPGKEKLFSLLENFRVSHNIDFSLNQKDGINEFEVRNNSIRIQGSNINLTSKWSLQGINISYNFTQKRWGYPSLGVQRQLHCWNMRFNWQPTNGAYTFFIGVASADLGQFLKYNYGQNVFDGRRF